MDKANQSYPADEYVTKQFPSEKPETQVQEQVEAFYEDIKDYVKNFKSYFDSRAETMGLNEKQKAERQEMFLNKLYEYCFHSCIRQLVEYSEMGAGEVGLEMRREALKSSYEIAVQQLDDIFSLIGLESTFTVEDVRQIESRGTKTTTGANITMRKPLPLEISEDFYKMREMMAIGTILEGDKFIRIMKGLYQSQTTY